jgi:hypothetical protein
MIEKTEQGKDLKVLVMAYCKVLLIAICNQGRFALGYSIIKEEISNEILL